jgi:hypothetical protein
VFVARKAAARAARSARAEDLQRLWAGNLADARFCAYCGQAIA